jgi:26S proteasome regulatory subunit T6
LDGFEPAQNIKVIMATNRIDILDAALLRPGRIDRKIEFPNPNTENRVRAVDGVFLLQSRPFG